MDCPLPKVLHLQGQVMFSYGLPAYSACFTAPYPPETCALVKWALNVIVRRECPSAHQGKVTSWSTFNGTSTRTLVCSFRSIEGATELTRATCHKIVVRCVIDVSEPQRCIRSDGSGGL